MNIIIMGPQGSGKTTQAKILAASLGVVEISAGEVSRQIASEDTVEGKRVKEEMNKGNLVPDNILANRLKQILKSEEISKGFVLDGWPRNKEQLDFLESFLSSVNKKIDKVFFIKLPDEIGIERIIGRIKTEHRTDDTSEAIKKRLLIYHQQTEPILKFYRRQGKLVEIDGSGTIEEVSQLVEKNVQ